MQNMNVNPVNTGNSFNQTTGFGQKASFGQASGFGGGSGFGQTSGFGTTTGFGKPNSGLSAPANNQQNNTTKPNAAPAQGFLFGQSPQALQNPNTNLFGGPIGTFKKNL